MISENADSSILRTNIPVNIIFVLNGNKETHLSLNWWWGKEIIQCFPKLDFCFVFENRSFNYYQIILQRFGYFQALLNHFVLPVFHSKHQSWCLSCSFKNKNCSVPQALSTCIAWLLISTGKGTLSTFSAANLFSFLLTAVLFYTV